MKNFKCKYCEATSFYHVFVPFKNPAYKTQRDPRWAFHISQVCKDCHKSVQFLKQDDELLAELDHAVMLPNFDLQQRELPLDS